MELRVPTSLILVIVVCVVHAQTTLTTIRRTIPSSGHGDRMGGSEESRRSSGEARSSGVLSAKATLDRTCYSISPTQEYSFSVWPPPRSNGYVYNRGQNVTLTCEVKNAMSVTQQPYVFITSCMNCSGWIESEAVRGKVELVLDGRTTSISNGDSGCQFSCWRYDNTCNTVPRPDLFRPRPIDCPLAAFGGALKTITFGELPRSEGVWCVSENWQGLTCTWTLTTGTQTWSHYTANGCLVSYSYPCDNMAARNNCTGPRTHVTTSIPIVSEDAGHIITQLLVPSGHFRQGQNYSVSFLIKSYYGEVRTTHNVTTDLKIVKFDRVRNIQVTSDDGNSSVLHVQWDIPEPAQSIAEVAHGLECRLRVVATSVPWLRYNATVPVSAEDCKRHHATVAGLHPHVTYDVHMQFRPKDVLYWSDEAKSSGTTMEDVPSRAPEATSGGYVTWSCGTGQCITVYWKGLAPQYQNGNLTEYLLSVYPHQTQRKLEGELHNHSVIHSSSADTRSLTVDRVNFTSARACVSAATSVGLSPVSNCITVLPRIAPGVPSSPQEVTVDHMTSSEDYIVRWTSGNSSSATADYVTVFWCWGNMNRTNVHCKSDMNWIDVTVTPSTATHTAVFAMKADKMADPRPAGDDGVTWQFGVASVVGNISHGITWNKCSFDERGQVLPPVFGVDNIRATSFTVTWIVSCDARFSFARPLRYFICYSQSTERHRHTTCTEGNRTEVNPKLGRNRLVIANLKPGATYSLCMAVVSYHGGSDVSAPTPVTLMQESHNGKDSRPLTIIIVMSALLSLSFVSLSVWLFRRKLKRTSRKFSPFFTYPEMAPTPTETAPAGGVNLTSDRNLPSTKTLTPCQRQTGTPQTIPDEAAWTGCAATTGTSDAVERPGKGAADRCPKNTAAETRNPQSPREIAFNTERCSSTVDKLPTCKTGCVGEPPLKGLGYVHKPSIDETGHAGNPASGYSGYVGKTSTGESGYVTVGKTSTGKSGYVTVGKTSTHESGYTTVGRTSTAESEYVTVGKTATAESEYVTVGKTATAESEYVTVGKTATGKSEYVTVGKTSTGESGYVTVGKTATAESEYVTVGKTATSESRCMRVGKSPTGKPAASVIVSPKHSPHQHHEERAANTVSSSQVPTTHYSAQPRVGEGKVLAPPERSPASPALHGFSDGGAGTGLKSTTLRSSYVRSNCGPWPSSSDAGSVSSTVADDRKRTTSDNVMVAERGDAAFVKTAVGSGSWHDDHDDNDEAHFEKDDHELQPATQTSLSSSSLPFPVVSDIPGAESRVTTCGEDRAPKSLQTHNAVSGTETYTRIISDGRSPKCDPEGSGTCRLERDTNITSEILSTVPFQGGNVIRSLAPYTKITSTAAEKGSNVWFAENQTGIPQSPDQRIATVSEVYTFSQPFSHPNYNANIGLCLNLHDKPSSYVSISENHELQEQKRQTPGAHPELLEADNFHTLDTEAEDISEVTPADVKPCHSQDPTIVSARDNLSWDKEHSGSLPFPVEGGCELKLISEFPNPDIFTRPLPAVTSLPLVETDQWPDDTLPKLSGLNETSFAEPTPYVRFDTHSGSSFERERVGADAPDVSRDTQQEGTVVRRQEGTEARRQQGTGIPRQQGTGVDLYVFVAPDEARDNQQDVTGLGVPAVAEPRVPRDAEPETTTRRQTARSHQTAVVSFPRTSVFSPCEREQSEILRHGYGFEPSFSTPYEGIGAGSQSGPSLKEQTENCPVTASASFSRLCTDTMPGVSTSNTNLPQKSRPHVVRFDMIELT